MIYELILTTKFKKSLKLAKKRGLNISLLDEIVSKIQNGEKLPKKNHDHQLTGDKKNFRECHIQPDWLLIYLLNENVLTLTLVDTGTHSDLLNL